VIQALKGMPSSEPATVQAVANLFQPDPTAEGTEGGYNRTCCTSRYDT